MAALAGKKVAIVTGGNKGIGLAIVRQLCQSDFTGDVILAARSEERGVAACETLEKEGLHPKFGQLEIADEKSVEGFRDFIQREYGGVDILVNNAGMAYKVASTAPLPEQARETIKTNFTGTLNVCRALFPLLRANARVVNVASRAGRLKRLEGSPWQSHFTSPTLTEDELVGLVAKYVSSVEKGSEKADGWPRDAAYSMSKFVQIALTKAHARQFQSGGYPEGVLVNSCCPGDVSTDMSSGRGQSTPDEGAETPVFLALLPPGSPSGEFFAEKQVTTW